MIRDTKNLKEVRAKMSKENNKEKSKPSEKSKPPTLEELLAKCTDNNNHEEFFRVPIGRELL